jgi:hypothetical protein
MRLGAASDMAGVVAETCEAMADVRWGKRVGGDPTRHKGGINSQSTTG